MIQPTKVTLVGFNGDHIKARGKITLSIAAKGKTHVIKMMMVVDAPSTYNMIVGCPWLDAMKAVLSTYHQKVKFSIESGID